MFYSKVTHKKTKIVSSLQKNKKNVLTSKCMNEVFKVEK
jgi:hypothetical protein